MILFFAAAGSFQRFDGRGGKIFAHICAQVEKLKCNAGADVFEPWFCGEEDSLGSAETAVYDGHIGFVVKICGGADTLHDCGSPKLTGDLGAHSARGNDLDV